MILFHDVIEVGTCSTVAPTPQFPRLPQFRDYSRVGRVAVHIDDAWAGMPRSPQGFLEEALGRSRIPLLGKPKIDGRTCGIDGPVEISPLPASQM